MKRWGVVFFGVLFAGLLAAIYFWTAMPHVPPKPPYLFLQGHESLGKGFVKEMNDYAGPRQPEMIDAYEWKEDPDKVYLRAKVEFSPSVGKHGLYILEDTAQNRMVYIYAGRISEAMNAYRRSGAMKAPTTPGWCTVAVMKPLTPEEDARNLGRIP